MSLPPWLSCEVNVAAAGPPAPPPRRWLLFTAGNGSSAASRATIWAFGRRITKTPLNVCATRMAALFVRPRATPAVRLRPFPADSPWAGYLTASSYCC